MITIVNYGVGNVASLANMFEHVGAEFRISGDPATIADSRKLVLPGVGAFGHAMEVLNRKGLTEAIKAAVEGDALLIGVCLGMQLLARSSEEGNAKGLGLIDAEVRRIVPSSPSIKIPNMGWREVNFRSDSWMTPAVSAKKDRFYFAHSYHMVCERAKDIVGTLDYDGVKTIAVEKGSVYGVQFHPEKSHRFGMRLLSAFAQLVKF
jgi:glutamine amidotransferase